MLNHQGRSSAIKAPMLCQLSERDLSSWLDDSMGQEAVRVEHHLHDCMHCAAKLIALRRAQRQLQRGLDEALGDVEPLQAWQNIRQRMMDTPSLLGPWRWSSLRQAVARVLSYNVAQSMVLPMTQTITHNHPRVLGFRQGQDDTVVADVAPMAPQLSLAHVVTLAGMALVMSLMLIWVLPLMQWLPGPWQRARPTHQVSSVERMWGRAAGRTELYQGQGYTIIWFGSAYADIDPTKADL